MLNRLPLISPDSIHTGHMRFKEAMIQFEIMLFYLKASQLDLSFKIPYLKNKQQKSFLAIKGQKHQNFQLIYLLEERDKNILGTENSLIGNNSAFRQIPSEDFITIHF